MNKPANFRLFILASVVALLLVSCGEFQRIVKKGDREQWYQKGLEYYEAGEYAKASYLLGGLITAYSGTIRSDTIIRYYAMSLMNQGDYYSASHYFQNYVKTFPSSESCEECQYLCAYCYYKLSPKVELDQSDTEKAIEEFQLYMNLYPEGEKVDRAAVMMKEMQDKLAYKSFMSAKLYFDLGEYMGNNYRSAVIVAQNCLKKYPDTSYREELSFLILEAKYIQAENSVVEKQSERYRDTIDEYYSFANEFPESSRMKKANHILASSEKGLKHAEKLVPPSQDDLDYYRNYGTRLDREAEAARAEEENK